MKKKYTVTVQFGSTLMCAIQTDDPYLVVEWAVEGWGNSVLNDVSVQVTKNKNK